MSLASTKVDLPTSRSQFFFLRALSASGRFFMFSAAKASERARERESESSTTGTGNEKGRTLRKSGPGFVRLAKQERKLRSGFFLK